MNRSRPLAAAALIALLSPRLASADEPGAAAAKPGVAPVERPPERRSTAMMAAGISLTASGAVAAGLGAAAVAIWSQPSGDVVAAGPILVGAASIGLGGLLVLTGVPLWIIGALPKAPPAASSAEPTGRSPALRVAIVPSVGGATLVGAF